MRPRASRRHPTTVGGETRGNIRLDRGQLAEAERLYREALQVRERSFGRRHRAIARSLLDLAQTYRLQERFAEAEPLVLEALAIREEVYGPVEERIAAALEEHALLLEATRREEEAARVRQRIERIRSERPVVIPD